MIVRLWVTFTFFMYFSSFQTFCNINNFSLRKISQEWLHWKGKHFSSPDLCSESVILSPKACACSQCREGRVSLCVSVPALSISCMKHSSDLTYAALTHPFLLCAFSSHFSVKGGFVFLSCPTAPSTASSLETQYLPIAQNEVTLTGATIWLSED